MCVCGRVDVDVCTLCVYECECGYIYANVQYIYERVHFSLSLSRVLCLSGIYILIYLCTYVLRWDVEKDGSIKKMTKPSANIKIECRDETGNTPLIIAALAGNLEVVRRIHDHSIVFLQD